jgi:hypothetical protein
LYLSNITVADGEYVPPPTNGAIKTEQKTVQIVEPKKVNTVKKEIPSIDPLSGPSFSQPSASLSDELALSWQTTQLKAAVRKRYAQIPFVVFTKKKRYKGEEQDQNTKPTQNHPKSPPLQSPTINSHSSSHQSNSMKPPSLKLQTPQHLNAIPKATTNLLSPRKPSSPPRQSPGSPGVPLRSGGDIPRSPGMLTPSASMGFQG